MATFRGVAETFTGKVIFVNVPTTEKRVYEFFGITETQIPSIVVADMGSETGDVTSLTHDSRLTIFLS